MEKRYPLTMMCAACLPWTEDFRFDAVSFRRQVRHLIEGGAKSIYILGTSGEGYSLDTAMYTEVVTAFLDECAKGEGVMPMIGQISTSMPEQLARIQIAYDLGARDFQIALPCWGSLTTDEVISYFKTVCGAFPDCRFIHYNNGNRSKTLVTIDQYVRIAEEVPNLVAAKYSTGNMYEIYKIAKTDCPISIFLVDGGYTYGAAIGSFGWLNSFASVDMDLAWMNFNAGQTKDLQTLTTLGQYYMELAEPLTIVDRPIMDSALDKSIERVADSRFSNTLYPPYTGLTEAEFAQIDASMKATVAKYRAMML